MLIYTQICVSLQHQTSNNSKDASFWWNNKKNDITKIQYSNDIKKKIRVGCEW